MPSSLYIGVMTGTSMDGIDLALTQIDSHTVKTLASYHQDIPSSLREALSSLCTPEHNEIERSGEVDVELGELIAKGVNHFLEEQALSPDSIIAIGSHGQTIRHCPDKTRPFTLQLGNPSVIAEKTGITTVADFRMADVAAGGQGAPLAPAFHEAVFASSTQTRVIVNLGGIANITLLSPEKESTGYDTGPANTLMDQWIKQHQGKDYDKNGEWAATGEVKSELLAKMLDDTYIKQAPPKSTGRERFNLDWLGQILDPNTYKHEDVQRTLLEFTAKSTAQEILKHCPPSSEIFLCGGGVFNPLLVERLKDNLSGYSIQRTDELGINSQLVEASAFAWLAYRTINQLSGNLPSVTGANKPKILGGVYLAS